VEILCRLCNDVRKLFVSQDMRTLTLLLLLITLGQSCKKDKPAIVNATVIKEGGAAAGYYLVEIEQPDDRHHSFICDASNPFPAASQYNCRNAIFITNLPSSARVPGTRIRFSKYRNLGRNPIWSSTLVPSDVEVYDVEIR
jgi:hypothetical protein